LAFVLQKLRGVAGISGGSETPRSRAFAREKLLLLPLFEVFVQPKVLRQSI
jgi:hypothetical protein